MKHKFSYKKTYTEVLNKHSMKKNFFSLFPARSSECILPTALPLMCAEGILSYISGLMQHLIRGTRKDKNTAVKRVEACVVEQKVGI